MSNLEIRYDPGSDQRPLESGTRRTGSNETKSAEKNSRTIWGSVLRILFWVISIFGSLISFPSVLPLMILFWILLAFASSLTGRESWPPVLFALIAVCIKQPDWTFSLILFCVACTAFCLARVCGRRSTITNFAALTFLLLLLCWISVDRNVRSTASNFRLEFDPDSPIVCLGDSLTAGGYPIPLAKLIDAQVLDYGRDGYSSADAIEKLLPQIESLAPQIVIVELGGHDFKDGRSRAETKSDLLEIIDRLHAVNSEVILVEVPRGFISDPFAGLEREVCAERDLQLISDSTIRSFIFWSPIVPPGSLVDAKFQLSQDGLHPNNRGSERFAIEVHRAIGNIRH